MQSGHCGSLAPINDGQIRSLSIVGAYLCNAALPPLSHHIREALRVCLRLQE
jgi:hypothetical protein